MDILPKTQIDPSKIKDPYSLLAAFLLIVESLLGFWFYIAKDSTDGIYERVFIGSIMTLIFIVFMFVVMRIVRELKGHDAEVKDEKKRRKFEEEEQGIDVSKPYLFSWDSVPGDHNEKLIRYLRNNFDISWVEKAEICKCGDSMTISISTDENSAEIKLSDTKEKAILRISDGRIYDLKVMEENGKLNIYGKPTALEGLDAVEICTGMEDVEQRMTDLLKETKESLYYHGGAGFVGAYQPWRQALDEKLNNETIKIVRLIDLKTPNEMKKILKETGKDEKDIKSEVDEYTAWLGLHARNLKSRVKWNAFYDFDGAPLWKYGVHQIIFDEMHVVIVFLSAGEVRNAIFIRNRPDVADAMVKSINWVVRSLHLESKTSEELEKIAARR
jgi:uncharacterized membrane protein